MRKNLKLSILALTVTLSSCISYRYIDIQVLNPRSAQIPSEGTIHFIKPGKISRDTIVSSIKDSSLIREAQKYLVINNLATSLKKHFDESPFFEKSQFIIQEEKSYLDEMKNKSIFEQRKNILLNIKDFYINVINRNKYDSFSEKDVMYKLKIELINAGTGQIYDSYADTDTLIWNLYDESSEEGYNRLPTTNEALEETGKTIADKYAQKIAPAWTTEERMLYYNGNKYMRQGYYKFTNNDFEGAVAEWKHIYDVGTQALASVAAHNIALTYEMQDDLENCKTWLIYSLSNKRRPYTEEYFQHIQERIALRDKLDNK